MSARQALATTVFLAGAAGVACSSPGESTDVGDVARRGSNLDAVDFSRPLPGVTADELARFEAGRDVFQEEEDVADGLGPVFNDVACSNCHNMGGIGGGGDFFETRFGRALDGTFDPLERLGGTLIQVRGIGSEGAPQPDCFFAGEVVPGEANVTALRRSTPLFGLGLVDAVPDQTFQRIADAERRLTPSTAGRVSLATNRANGTPAVAKFGWKAQVQSLFEFSGNAYVNEMGITSPLFPLENCPNGDPDDCPIMDRCNPAPGVNDDGEDVVRFADFMTFLAPPPRGAITLPVLRGEARFAAIGCANCHLPVLVTGQNPSAALSNRVFQPFSDFLLHDMGALGDGIGGDQADASGVEAIATRREMRTAPLWGLRVLDRFLHDGRATTVTQAIEAHDGQGAAARDRFLALGPGARSDLLAFLQSL